MADFGHSNYYSTPAGTNKGGNASKNEALMDMGAQLLRDELTAIVNDDEYAGVSSLIYTSEKKADIDKFLSNQSGYDSGVIAETYKQMAGKTSMLHNGGEHWQGDVFGQPTTLDTNRRGSDIYAYNLSVPEGSNASVIKKSLGLPADYEFISSSDSNTALKATLENTSMAANKKLKEAQEAYDKAKKEGKISYSTEGNSSYAVELAAAKNGVASSRKDFVDAYRDSFRNQLVNEMAYTRQVCMSTLSNEPNDGVDSEKGQFAMYQYAYSTLRLSRYDSSLVDAEKVEEAKKIIKAADPSVDFEEFGKQIDKELTDQMHADFVDLIDGNSSGYDGTDDDEVWLKDIEDGTYNLDEALFQGDNSADLSIDLVADKKEREEQAVVQAERDKLEAYFMAQGTKKSAEDIDKAWNELDADTQKKLNENLVGRTNYLGPTYSIPYNTPGESSALYAAESFAEKAVDGDYGSAGHWQFKLEESLKAGNAYQIGIPGSSSSKIIEKYLSEDEVKDAFSNPACTDAIITSYKECTAQSDINAAHKSYKDAANAMWKYLPDDKKQELEDSLQGPPDGKYVFKLSEDDIYDSDGESVEPDIEALRANYYDELYRYAMAHDDSELAGKAAKNLSEERVTSANTWLEENKDYDWTKSQFDADYVPPVKGETKDTEVKTVEVNEPETKNTPATVDGKEISDPQVPLASSPENEWTAEKIAAMYAEAGDDRTKIAQLDYQMATEVWKGNIGSGDDRKAMFGDQYERIQLCAINNISNGSMTAWAAPGTDEYDKLIENLAVDGAAYDICDGKDIDIDDLTQQGLDDNAILTACDKWQGKDTNQAAVTEIETATKVTEEKQPTAEPEPERKQIENPEQPTGDNKPERTEKTNFNDLSEDDKNKLFGAASKSYADKYGWDLSSPEAFKSGNYELNNDEFFACMDAAAKEQGVVYDKETVSNGLTSAGVAGYATYAANNYAGDVKDVLSTYTALPDETQTETPAAPSSPMDGVNATVDKLAPAGLTAAATKYSEKPAKTTTQQADTQYGE